MKRRGSALLVVLGMMAFIVVSAIAFAAYMRQARMPSSYLRRTSSSRLLAKAALANAIDILDESIGNSAYPGQTGIDDKNYSRISSNEDERNRVKDLWCGRCFIGPTNQLAATDSTVATLCLEALAYIPPPLINEVRYYSRRSLAGQWHAMSFDAGRYAFCAVDVSDYFDINRVRCLTADASGQEIFGRNSSDLGRISLAHCFENQNHTGYRIDPSTWDDFLEDFLDDSTKVPIVSLADLNLAINKKGLDEALTPFCRFIKSGTAFVKSSSGDEANLQRNLCFVADSVMMLTNRVADALDLSNPADQPFGTGYTYKPCSDDTSKNDDSLEMILNGVGSGNRYEAWLDKMRAPFFNSPETVQLYDYLDKDSIPLSLSMPTVERTPMITGVSLDIQQLQASATTTKDGPKYVPTTPQLGGFQYEKEISTLKLNGTVSVGAGFVFPFKYRHGDDHTYKAQAALTVTFVSGDCEKLRRDSAKTVVTWNNSKQSPQLVTANGTPMYVQALSEMQNLSLPSESAIQSGGEEATIINDLKFDFNFSSLEFKSELPAAAPFTDNDNCSVRVIHKKQITQLDTSVTPPVVLNVGPDDPTKEFPWLPSNVTLDGTVAQSDVESGANYYPVFQVWVRIVEGSKTVDLSPAYYKDDSLTGGTAVGNPGILPTAMKERPLLRFWPATLNANSSVSFDGEKLVANADLGTIGLTPRGYMANDPRFNYAPEDLWAITEDKLFQELWKGNAIPSAQGRDGDIFMTTSDAGYLQSAYELAYILRVSGTGNDYWGVLDGAGRYDGAAATGFGDMAAQGAMWNTYSQYDCNGRRGDIDYLGIINGSKGFRQTPFAQSAETLLPVFANAPIDWWAASTNDVNDSAKQTALSSAAGAAKYQFTEMSGATYKMDHDDVESFASMFMSAMRCGGSGTIDWRTKFDNLGWDNGDENQVCGQTFQNLKFHSVDRKFLHGYFKECFDNRQQLFLVFVRAEPMMLGGGGVGQTPPQLGSRAVAVVWRDPTPTLDDNSGTGTSGNPRPHRTRILFYRQFD